MPSPFRVEVDLPIPADVLWRVRASRSFTSYLVSIGALNRMDSSPARHVPGHPSLRTRVQTYVPADIDIPDVVKPVFDDSYIEISDTQTWHHPEPVHPAATFEQRFDITPSVLANLVRSSGLLRLQPAPADPSRTEHLPDRCTHILDGQCTVSVPFLGWYIEQAIIANMQSFYKLYPAYIQRFADMVVKRWGDGHPTSLHRAVDRMLAEDKAAE